MQPPRGAANNYFQNWNVNSRIWLKNQKKTIHQFFLLTTTKLQKMLECAIILD